MKKIYQDEDILAYLQEIAVKLGRSPTVREANRYSPNTYRRRFKTFNNAIIKVNLIPSNPNEYNEEDPHRFHASITNRFGSWNNSLTAANLKLNMNSGGFGTCIYENDELFMSKFEHACYKKIIRYIPRLDIIRNHRYWNKTRHTCDFYIPKIKLWVEVSTFKWESYLNNIQFKQDIVENVYKENFIFIDDLNYLDNLLTSAYDN